jgi:hypothetical protein
MYNVKKNKCMGLFDLIFGRKKEEERLQREKEEARRLLFEKENAERKRRLEEERLAKERAEREKVQQQKSFDSFTKVPSGYTNSNRASSIKYEVDEIIRISETNNIPILQQKLYELVSKFNQPGSGKLITSYPEKDKLCEVFVMCLNYDWLNDTDIREVWAENAFYCIAKYFSNLKNQQDLIAAALNLFLTCSYGKCSLYPKFNDILRKAYQHPVHCTIFSEENYQGGAEHLVREFRFFSATLLSPLVKQYPQIISPSLQGEFQSAKTDFEFAAVSPEDINKKMKLISDIIGSILNDM